MSDIEDFWIELFGMPPTPTEATLMQAVLQKVNSSDSILFNTQPWSGCSIISLFRTSAVRSVCSVS